MKILRCCIQPWLLWVAKYIICPLNCHWVSVVGQNTTKPKSYHRCNSRFTTPHNISQSHLQNHKVQKCKIMLSFFKYPYSMWYHYVLDQLQNLEAWFQKSNHPYHQNIESYRRAMAREHDKHETSSNAELHYLHMSLTLPSRKWITTCLLKEVYSCKQLLLLWYTCTWPEGNLDIVKDQPKELSRNNSVQLDVKYIQNQYKKMWLNIAYVHSEVRLGRWGEDALTVPRPFCIWLSHNTSLLNHTPVFSSILWEVIKKLLGS